MLLSFILPEWHIRLGDALGPNKYNPSFFSANWYPISLWALSSFWIFLISTGFCTGQQYQASIRRAKFLKNSTTIINEKKLVLNCYAAIFLKSWVQYRVLDARYACFVVPCTQAKILDSGATLAFGCPLLAAILRPLWTIWHPPELLSTTIVWRPAQPFFGAPGTFLLPPIVFCQSNVVKLNSLTTCNFLSVVRPLVWFSKIDIHAIWGPPL